MKGLNAIQSARRAGGFTLIELMVVVAIVGILGAVAYPSYVEHVNRGRRAVAQGMLSDFATRQHQFFVDTRGYAASVAALRVSVPADVAILDSDYDGYIDRGYAADLGGRVYRLDLETGSGNDVAYSAADWKLTLFADLGSSASRKIFYPPDVVLTRDYGIVMVGTGDREKPLDNTTNEKFFTLIDPITGKGMPADFTAIAESDLTTGEEFSSPATQRGCFVPLNTAGEKVVNSPTTAGGITYFSTNRPTPPSGNSCTGSLGEAKVYGIPLMCKEPESQVLTGGGLPPSPVTGNVLIDLGNGEQRRVPFIIGGFNSKRSGIEGSKVQVAVPPRRQKLFWFTETER